MGPWSLAAQGRKPPYTEGDANGFFFLKNLNSARGGSDGKQRTVGRIDHESAGRLEGRKTILGVSPGSGF